MPPKSKKAADKAKAKVIEDKTFGLKNKNRSAKVQAYVQQVTKTVKQGNPNEQKKRAEMEAKKDSKKAKQAFEAEMAALFREAKVDKPKEEEKPGDEDGNFGVDADDYRWTADDFEAVEEDNTRLEEQLEKEREALKGRTDLTPVTEETFQAWKAAKRAEAEKKEKERLEKAKKKGGMRGRDLWEHDRDLFVDDEDADDFFEREEDEMDEEEKAMIEAAGGVKVFADPMNM